MQEHTPNREPRSSGPGLLRRRNGDFNPKIHVSSGVISMDSCLPANDSPTPGARESLARNLHSDTTQNRRSDRFAMITRDVNTDHILRLGRPEPGTRSSAPMLLQRRRVCEEQLASASGVAERRPWTAIPGHRSEARVR